MCLGQLSAGRLACERMWTSPVKLDNVPLTHQKELCSVINVVIRNDADGELMSSVCVLVGAINQLVVMRRQGSSQFPEDGLTFRGGALPLEHFPFFSVGKKYRVPMYLATSFSRDVAERFMMSAAWSGITPVIWTVRVDPRGASIPRFRCRHVN